MAVTCKVALVAVVSRRGNNYDGHRFSPPWIDSDSMDFGPETEGDEPTWTETATSVVTVSVPDGAADVLAEAARLAVEQAPSTGFEGKGDIAVAHNAKALYPVEILYDTPADAAAAVELLLKVPACRTLSHAIARYFGAYERGGEWCSWHMPWYQDPDGLNVNSADSLATEPMAAAALCQHLCPGQFPDIVAEACAMMKADGVDQPRQLARYMLCALVARGAGRSLAAGGPAA